MHKHHIIPKHMGGSDDPSNLIELTIEQHSEVHRLLFEQHGHWQDELAWKALSKQINKEEIIKKLQKLPKSEEWKRKMSERMKGANNPRYGKPGTMLGKEASDETKRKQSEARAHMWEITTPSGTKEIIVNLTEYCKIRGLQQTNMVKVSKGIYSQHKGYHCKKLLTKSSK